MVVEVAKMEDNEWLIIYWSKWKIDKLSVNLSHYISCNSMLTSKQSIGKNLQNIVILEQIQFTTLAERDTRTTTPRKEVLKNT